MQVLQEQEVKEQIQRAIVTTRKKERKLKRISASRKAYLKRVESTPYIESIDIVDLPMLELCIPNYKIILKMCNTCLETMNKLLVYQKRKMDTFEKLVDARENRHYINSQEDYESMAYEEKKPLDSTPQHRSQIETSLKMTGEFSGKRSSCINILQRISIFR
jgi:hypothetical protein